MSRYHELRFPQMNTVSDRQNGVERDFEVFDRMNRPITRLPPPFDGGGVVSRQVNGRRQYPEFVSAIYKNIWINPMGADARRVPSDRTAAGRRAARDAHVESG
ncbi:hypothetical protein GCM10009017_11820 [Halarchaeum rubridurum]|uniref:Uncharacterized protein n=1 Tax=Halarchaeum rubridurum TaxID=489911 RepID=A0A830FYS1_9EURY|nr:hypothetical protein GCM10009017_11820 [Halarchaeum rubridurum]